MKKKKEDGGWTKGKIKNSDIEGKSNERDEKGVLVMSKEEGEDKDVSGRERVKGRRKIDEMGN